jgi:hypothetical protein
MKIVSNSIVIFLITAGAAVAQSPGDLKAVLERLDRLEQENKSLRGEVRQLRDEVSVLRGAPPGAPEQPTTTQTNSERLEVQETRVEELAQSKVESSQKFPIRITGMALFNAYHGGTNSGSAENPVTAATTSGNVRAGATFRQSVLGLEYNGPATVFGGKVRGSFYMDFYDGPLEDYYSYARVRTASIEVDWKSRSLLVGLEKPMFAPREPTSLSQVGISPLTGSGNLWRWMPQVRLEQKLKLAPSTELRAQFGVMQTGEDYPGAVNPAGTIVERRRPGWQGRFEIAHKIDEDRRIEIAPGFHFSTSHVNGVSVPSQLFSLDWFANPIRRVQFSGAFFAGENVAHFGATRQGYTFLPDGRIIPVRGIGGWGQLTFLATSKLSFNLFNGQQDDRNADLTSRGIAKNLTWGGNAMYRLAPNVIVSFEALQLRTTYMDRGLRLNNRYDLAVAYLF